MGYGCEVAQPAVGDSFEADQTRPIGFEDDVYTTVSEADRERLLATISGAEEWLMARILVYAHALGYTQYTPTLFEAWRLSVAGLTQSIATTVAGHSRVPELGPDENFGADPGAAFGITEARTHRRRGVNLAMFLGLFKYYRQAYHRLLADPVKCPMAFDDANAVATYLERIFDRFELGYISEWAVTSAETQVRELSAANLLATNEKNRMLTLIESLPIPAMLVSPQRKLDMANYAAAELIIGDSAVPGQVYYQPASEDVPFPEWARGIVDAADERSADRQQPGEPLEVVVDLGTAGRKTFRAFVERMLDISEKFAGYAVLLVDVTRERADALGLREAAAVFEDSTNAIVVTDPNGSVLAVNPAMAMLLGMSAHLTVGRDIVDLLGSDGNLWPRATQPSGQFWTDRRWHGEVTLTASKGEPVTGWLTLSSVETAVGVVERVIGVFTDVSSLKASEERFEHLSNHDPLTGLYNRTGLRAELEATLRRARSKRRSVAVLFLDLDRFKEINDSHGHSVGDHVLQQIGERLQVALRSDDILARIGGDEFLAVTSGIHTEREVGIVANKVLSCLRATVYADDLSFEVTGSVGVAVFPRDGEDAEVLIRNADAAMYRAKEQGPDHFAIYTPELTKRASQRLQLETELRGAIRTGNGLTLAYQPILDLRSGEPVAVEALLRWHHDRLGDVPPVVFVPIAEDIGLMPRLGKWVLNEALEQLSSWDTAGLRIPRMSVNASPTQIERPEFRQEIQESLESSNITGERLVVEVTEEALFRARTVGARALHHIRDLDVKVAIDDFGEGYSSLSRLQALPVDIVKIDRAFISGLDSHNRDSTHRRAVAAAITDLVHAFGKTIVAEGVEDRDTANYLTAANCELAQGYLYSRPLTPSDLATRWPEITALDVP